MNRAPLLLTALLALASGCGWSIRHHIDDSLVVRSVPPAYRLDVEASSVEYLGNRQPTDADALDAREVIGEILRANARPERPGAPKSPPARFRAKLEIIKVVWPEGWTPWCLDLQLVGCPTGTADATAQIEVQIGNDLYWGRGAGTGYGGLYYNAFSGAPSALAEAIQVAIGNLTPVGRIVRPGATPSSGP